MPENAIQKAVILGASGYTGAELVRLLLSHPNVEIVALTGDSQAGKTAEEVYPHLRGAGLPALISMDEVSWDGVDVAFACLPHGASQSVIATIPEEVVIIDLSADFRLKDADVYAEWYGAAHTLPDMLGDAVYGLTEVAGEEVSSARLIACPGCYPTSVQLPLIPLLEQSLIVPETLIVDAKSGVTGAGRSVKLGNLFSEVNEGVGAYGIGCHRHIPEIEQTLSAAAGRSVEVSFTPHLMPMNRGILATIYAELESDITVEDVRTALQRAYGDAPFVYVCAKGEPAPTTHQVRGTNRCMMSVYADRRTSRVIIISAIDNLLKGASGQAVQNFNLRFGLDETTGLDAVAVFP